MTKEDVAEFVASITAIQLWRHIDETWGLLTAGEVAKALNLPGTQASAVSLLRTQGQLLAVKRPDGNRYPGFQFDPDISQVRAVIIDLVRLAGEVNVTQENIVIWLCSPSGYFSGDLPIQHLNEPGELLAKARDEATVEW